MEPANPWSSERKPDNDNGQGNSQKPPAVRVSSRARTIDQNFLAALDTMEIPTMSRTNADTMDEQQFLNITEDKRANIDTQDIVEHTQADISLINRADTLETTSVIQNTPLPAHYSGMQDENVIDTLDTQVGEVTPPSKKSTKPLTLQETTDESAQPDTSISSQENTIVHLHSSSQQTNLKRGTAAFLIALLGIMVLRTFSLGPTNFLGSQGWASVLGGPATTGDPNLLKSIGTQLHQSTKPGAKVTTKTQMTPQQYIDLIVNRMTLDQKLGQLMIVQFTGATYSLPISTMISQYNVGAVLVFSANGNIVSKDQLTTLIKQMKDNSTTIPLAVAIDQEGGTVDRLADLDGARPAEAAIGATNDPAQAKQDGIQTAQDLTSYGFNLNLAPVVDVSNVYNPQMYGRTYGNTPGLVTKMAEAYLQGLQQSGKVVGTLKHFPGLGDVSTDPHVGIPYLNRAKSDLEQIDWAPYRALIKQGNVHAIMVTHEIVSALDKTEPSSLSPKVIQGILRNELGFQGVVMTDSLTMDALTAYAPSEGQAAVMSIEAGSDLIMGAGSPENVASMFQAIKQAISTGTLTEQRINDSVRRILMMKYAMGLLSVPQN